MIKFPKTISSYIPILLALALISGIYIGKRLSPNISLSNSKFKYHSPQYNKLSDIINYIEQDYVDSIQREKLTKEAINAVIKKLDPHTQYISREDYNAINDPLLGSFEGIGVRFNFVEDTIVIIHTIPGGPSEKLGILAGDRIISVNDTLMAGLRLSNSDAIRKLKGPRGSKVNVGILRRGVSEIQNYTITRDIIPTYSVDIAYMPDDSVGYIKLNTFSATTYNEFRASLVDLKKQGLASLIIDLRSNTGGYVRQAEQIADELLSEDKLIVYTEGNNRPKTSTYSTDKGLFEEGEVIILIDGNSASASEILAGAIQDNDRGLIIGRRSFGKGLIQEQLNFPDGSALRMTIARYYTPTGRSIQKPYKEGFDNYYGEFHRRYMNGELLNQDSIHFPDSLKFTTAGGKTVYGGGGIMPDEFVPLETTNPAFYNIVFNKGLVYQYTFNFTDKHRAELSNYLDFETFDSEFIITDDIYKDFVSYVKDEGVNRSQSEIDKSEEKLKIMLKAFIGRNVLDNEAFYPIYHRVDPIFQKALDIIKTN